MLSQSLVEAAVQALQSVAEGFVLGQLFLGEALRSNP